MFTDTAESYGCQYTGNINRMRYDVARLPTQDIYGNATTAGYRTVNLSRPDLALPGRRGRLQCPPTAPPHVIYTIGLGGTSPYPPEQTLLRRIANDPTSPVYDPARPTGLFVWSPSTAQLQAAFLRIASEILRLVGSEPRGHFGSFR